MSDPYLGKHRLIVELARGGMGIVYLATDTSSGNRLVIVKELRPELTEDPAFLEMFFEEARLATRLDHPNIVRTFEVGSDGNRHFLAMEYLQGETFSRLRRRNPPRLTALTQVRVLVEVLRGLHHAHTLTDVDSTDKGIVHRDVSPHNVFVTYDGRVKLVDFGIAKAADTHLETKTGMLKGKASYMAPEQLRGDTLDGRTDVFAVGIMLWEALVRRRFWSSRSDVEILTRLIKNDLPKWPDRALLPGELATICEKAVAWDARDRYATAEAMADDLDAYLRTVPEAPSLLEVGELVAETFAAEREKVRQVVEAQLSDPTMAGPRGTIPSIAPPAISDNSLTPSQDSGSQRSFSASESRTMSAGFSATKAEEIGPAREAAAKTSHTWVIGLSAGVAGAAGIGVLVVLALRGLQAPTAPGPAAVTLVESASAPVVHPSAPVTAVEAPASYAIVVRVTPPTAVVAVNGKPVDNPATTRCARGQSLVVKMDAAGFVSKTRTLVCDSDSTLDVTLERAFVASSPAAPPQAQPRVVAANPTQPPSPPAAPVAPAAPPPATNAAPAPTPAPAHPPTATATDINPQGGKVPRRSIDPSNPY